MEILRNIAYAFPIQLLINHLKRNHVLLFFWLVLVGTLTGHLGSFLGLRHLFLSPEYLGQSGFLSFAMMGIALGGFTMVFHSTTCLLDMHRFLFVGALAKPFVKFCLNNSVVPLAYLATYVSAVFRFQYIEQRNTPTDVLIKIIGLLLGFALIASLMFMYMAIASTDIFAYRKKSMAVRLRQAFFYRLSRIKKIIGSPKDSFRVRSYLETPFRVGYTKHLDKYHDPAAILQIFSQNQFHLIIFEIMAVALLLGLGLGSHYAFSQIPAAASLILFLAILMMLLGFLSFWVKGWATTVIILLVVTINLLTELGITPGAKESRAFGLCYTSDKADYSLATIKQVTSQANYQEDRHNTLQILNNWRQKFPSATAPKLVVVCASGGGQKAALWALKVLQTADSITQGKLMEHTMLMSCVSGGALGASYFRELCLRKKLGETIDPYAGEHLDRIARNLLNPVVFNFFTNDILLDINKFQYRGMTYRRDRGYALEEQVDRHTDAILEKSLKAYRKPELESLIPMMFLTPTIINDGRKIFISPHQVSYMGTSLSLGKDTKSGGKVRGIDFMRFFKNQGGGDLRFLSALRMAATYPYVLPSVTLPSLPAIEVADAGLFDNFGVDDALRFLYVFRDWIAQNTSGVALVTIRSTPKERQVSCVGGKSLFQRLNNPTGGLQTAWINMQDIRNDHLIELTRLGLVDGLTEIEFQCAPATPFKEPFANTEKVSLSWHLTAEEKTRIIQAMEEQKNQASLKQLEALLR